MMIRVARWATDTFYAPLRTKVKYSFSVTANCKLIGNYEWTGSPWKCTGVFLFYFYQQSKSEIKFTKVLIRGELDWGQNQQKAFLRSVQIFLLCVPTSRLVHSGSARSSPAQGSELVFATRTGTGRGIESHVFRVETHWDLSSWTRAMVQGAHAAAELIKEVSIGGWFVWNTTNWAYVNNAKSAH